jgi:hypothetical protein
MIRLIKEASFSTQRKEGRERRTDIVCERKVRSFSTTASTLTCICDVEMNSADDIGYCLERGVRLMVLYSYRPASKAVSLLCVGVTAIQLRSNPSNFSISSQ